MSELTREQIDSLTAAIRSQEHLRRIVDEIEQLHRIVFHANKRADWSLARRSAEQILTAEIVCRHRGCPEGIYYALRAMEDDGKSWETAIRELAASIHSYFTTPLGIVMRQNLFGRQAVFPSPDAREWTAQAWGRAATGDARTP